MIFEIILWATLVAAIWITIKQVRRKAIDWVLPSWALAIITWDICLMGRTLEGKSASFFEIFKSIF